MSIDLRGHQVSRVDGEISDQYNWLQWTRGGDRGSCGADDERGSGLAPPPDVAETTTCGGETGPSPTLVRERSKLPLSHVGLEQR